VAARRKVEHEGVCRKCGEVLGLQAAHIARREFDRNAPVGDPDSDEFELAVLVVEPDRIVPLCPECHRKYDAHELDLLGALTTEEETQLVADLGLEAARKRICPSDYAEPIQAARRRGHLEAA
jgi:hypothetical protein